MKFNRRAILEGWYWYCADYHGGQWSWLYKRLCKIYKYYKPGFMQTGPESEESIEIYNNCVRLKRE
jgi:hypothetical protein